MAWTRVTIGASGPIPDAYEVRGLARRSNGELWVSLSDGTLRHTAPGGLAFGTSVANVVAETTQSKLGAIATLGDEVIVAFGTKVYRCAADCDDFSSYTPKSMPSLAYATGVCAGNGKAWVLLTRLGRSGGVGTIEQGTGAWTVVMETGLDISGTPKCEVTPGGDVVIGGNHGVIVLDSSGGESAQMTVPPDLDVRTVTRLGNAGLLGGLGHFATLSGSQWPSQSVSGVLLFTSALLLSETEGLLGQNGNGDQGARIFRWTGGTGLTPLNDPLLRFEVHQGLRVSEDEVYFAGAGIGFGGYVVARGQH